MNEFIDPYSYENGTLKNIKGITDDIILSEYEYKTTARVRNSLSIMKLSLDTICSVEGYKGIHKELFKDVFEWAGKFRTIDISKGGTEFCPYSFIDNCLRNCLAEIYQNRDKIDNLEVFSKYYSDLNYVHPFREGNGRTQHFFWNTMLEEKGYYIDFDELNNKYRNEFFTACKNCTNHLKLEAIKNLFSKVIKPAFYLESKTERKEEKITRIR